MITTVVPAPPVSGLKLAMLGVGPPPDELLEDDELLDDDEDELLDEDDEDDELVDDEDDELVDEDDDVTDDVLPLADVAEDVTDDAVVIELAVEAEEPMLVEMELPEAELEVVLVLAAPDEVAPRVEALEALEPDEPTVLEPEAPIATDAPLPEDDVVGDTHSPSEVLQTSPVWQSLSLEHLPEQPLRTAVPTSTDTSQKSRMFPPSTRSSGDSMTPGNGRQDRRKPH